MATTAEPPQASDAEDVRSYILSMLIELADMAERVEEQELAVQLRDLVWPPSSLDRFSGPARL